MKTALMMGVLLTAPLGCASTGSTYEAEQRAPVDEDFSPGSAQLIDSVEFAQKEEKVCRYEAPIGSKLPRKVCTTAQERAEQRQSDLTRFQYLPGQQDCSQKSRQ